MSFARQVRRMKEREALIPYPKKHIVEAIRRADTRYCYSVGCTWHDHIHNVGRTSGMPGDYELPCCPGCGAMLFEVPSPEVFWEGVKKLADQRKDPTWLPMMQWSRGKCFEHTDAMRAAYQAELEADNG